MSRVVARVLAAPAARPGAQAVGKADRLSKVQNDNWPFGFEPLGALLATAVYAETRGWVVVVPVLAWAGGLDAALLIGALAGLFPFLRAARMSPTEALWSV